MQNLFPDMWSHRHEMPFLAMTESPVGPLSHMHKCGVTERRLLLIFGELIRISSTGTAKQYSQTWTVRGRDEQPFSLRHQANSRPRKKFCNWQTSLNSQQCIIEMQLKEWAITKDNPTGFSPHIFGTKYGHFSVFGVCVHIREWVCI